MHDEGALGAEALGGGGQTLVERGGADGEAVGHDALAVPLGGEVDGEVALAAAGAGHVAAGVAQLGAVGRDVDAVADRDPASVEVVVVDDDGERVAADGGFAEVDATERAVGELEVLEVEAQRLEVGAADEADVVLHEQPVLGAVQLVGLAAVAFVDGLVEVAGDEGDEGEAGAGQLLLFTLRLPAVDDEGALHVDALPVVPDDVAELSDES